MDKEILLEYKAMKEEIKDLRRRIDNNRRELDKLNDMIVTDSVACGKKGKKPIRTVKIQGMPSRLIERKRIALERNSEKLESIELKLIDLSNEVEQYIATIKKSELRIMFRLYFVDDLSYAKVADKMNDMFPKRDIAYTDENVKKRIQRFFQNVPQCPDKT